MVTLELMASERADGGTLVEPEYEATGRRVGGWGRLEG